MVKEIFHIFILFMIMTFIVIFNESSIVFDIEFYKNNINVLISLANLIIMIIYVWCTKKIMDENINTNKNILEQIKLQEIQFKKASFVQHESEVLIKFKNAILL